MWCRDELKQQNQGYSLPMTIRRRTMLEHAFETEYDLADPYVCEGYGKTIREREQYPPESHNHEIVYIRKHFSQKHGRPHTQYVALTDVAFCTMYGEHSLCHRFECHDNSTA